MTIYFSGKNGKHVVMADQKSVFIQTDKGGTGMKKLGSALLLAGVLFIGAVPMSVSA